MGKAMSMLTRTAQRFNVENRAHKVISRDKPTPAPRHKTARQFEPTSEESSRFLKEHNTKDAKLDDRLRDVYLLSHGRETQERFEPENPDRPLPKRRTTADDLEFGVFEPADIRKGRCTLSQAIQFIADHNSDPGKYTVADIASQYKLNQESTDNILKYFKTFKVYIPEPKSEENTKRPPLPWEKKSTAEDTKQLK